MPAPAPWPTTITAGSSPAAGVKHPADTPPSGVGRRNRASDMRAMMAGHVRQLLPGALRVRVRRVAPRRLLSGGPSQGRHAHLLLVAAVVRGGELHVPPLPHRLDAGEVARSRSRR